MTGTGMLEFGLAGTGTPGARVSRIRDIALRAPPGPAVTGEMRFVFHTDDGPVATADKAWLRLDFGNYSADLRLRLLVWLHADGRAGGAFTGMTADPGDPDRSRGRSARCRLFQRCRLCARLRCRELKIGKVAIERRLVDQLLMRSGGDDPAAIEKEDPVGPDHRCQPVRDDDRGAVLHQRLQRRLNRRL